MKSTTATAPLMSKFMILAILCWFAFQPTLVLAKIYKYKDDQGKTHFTDDPSQIPLKYRKKDKMETFKESFESDPSAGSPPPGFGNKTGAQGEAGKNGAGGKEEGFSEKDEAVAKKAIQVFKGGIAIANKYKDVQHNFSNVRGLIDALQGALPQKESLAKELAGTKVPELQEALAFLKSSIAEDKKTQSVGAGLKRAIAGVFNRVAGDAAKQTALIAKLEKAMKDSKKKKAEAEKKKAADEKKKGSKKGVGGKSGQEAAPGSM